MMLLALLACTAKNIDQEAGYQFPAATEMPEYRGPGGPNIEFTDAALFANCAQLDGGEQDSEHHNLVIPYRGHLVMPWAPEWGQGGLSLFDVSDPCNPQKVGEGFHERMRESHAIGFMHIPERVDETSTDHSAEPGDYAVVTGNLGLQFWDLSSLERPEMLHYLQIDGVFYPDSYTRVVLSVFWQYPYVYVAAADNGIFIVDASNPEQPETVTQYTFDPPMRAAGVFAMGNQLLVTAAEGSEAEIVDISDPVSPQPIAGGRFNAVDSSGQPYEAYHGNMVGNWGLFARKEDGGGIIVMDISDPSNPTYRADVHTEGGNGGYVFYDEGYGFLGDSNWAKVFDMRDLDNIVELGTGYLAGDLDTITPYGNVAILSVDDEAENGIASAIMPWIKEIDTRGPQVLRAVPADGEENVPLSSRVGIGFNEMIEPSSVFAGSIRLYDAQGNAVDGWGSGQEAIANYTPKQPLLPNMTYTIEVVVDGVRDINDNAIEYTFSSSFSTVGSSQ